MKQDERVDNTLNLLNRLDGWLRANRPDYYAKLLPGLSAAEFDEFEQKLGVQLPVEFKLFYRWKNGFLEKHNDDDEFIAGRVFLPSHLVIDIFNQHNELLKNGTFNIANWWNYNWIPFVESVCNDYWCIDLEGSFNGVPGQIVGFWFDTVEREIICSSFYNWLETVVTAFEMGRWWLGDGESDDDYLNSEGEDTFEAFWNLWSEHNPGYPLIKEAG